MISAAPCFATTISDIEVVDPQRISMFLGLHAGLAVEFWLPSCGTWSNVMPSTLLLKFFQGLWLGVGYGGQGTPQRRFEGPHTIFVTLLLS